MSGQQQRQQLAVKMYKKMFLLCLFNGFYGRSFLASLSRLVDNVNKQIKRTFVFENEGIVKIYARSE